MKIEEERTKQEHERTRQMEIKRGAAMPIVPAPKRKRALDDADLADDAVYKWTGMLCLSKYVWKSDRKPDPCMFTMKDVYVRVHLAVVLLSQAIDVSARAAVGDDGSAASSAVTLVYVWQKTDVRPIVDHFWEAYCVQGLTRRCENLCPT